MLRRLAAPLVLGTAMIATTVAAAAGPRLADLDTWVWLAVGGAALIGLAVLVERTVNGEDGVGPRLGAGCARPGADTGLLRQVSSPGS